MYKILITDEEAGKVVLDIKTKSLLLSALDETSDGVRSLSINNANLVDVAQVLAGANAAVKRTSMDHPLLPVLTGLFTKMQSSKEVRKSHGRD